MADPFSHPEKDAVSVASGVQPAALLGGRAVVRVPAFGHGSGEFPVRTQSGEAAERTRGGRRGDRGRAAAPERLGGGTAGGRLEGAVSRGAGGG